VPFRIVVMHERIAIALVELCSDFGVEESRGTLLRVAFSHKNIANLVGASRPRVTEHLARLEREKFMMRQGRQMVVQVAKLLDSMNAQAGRLFRGSIRDVSKASSTRKRSRADS
jgi:hypothetical protein